MVESPLYKKIYQDIESNHPDLIMEITSDDLEPDESRRFALGNFIEMQPQDREEWGQYKIMMKVDHPKADNETELVSALVHEYGHYLCRSKLYPRLSLLGSFFQKKLDARPIGTRSWEWGYTTRAVTVTEEFLAWVLGLSVLRKFGGFGKEHLKVAKRCFKTYLPRLKWKR
jgi:hypothetical protein